MENMPAEESIDLGKLMHILYDRCKTVGKIVGGTVNDLVRQCCEYALANMKVEK